MRNRSHNPKLRSALFSLADARGNNPHGTTETSVHEGKRLNAKRYETVEQLDRALDSRARRPRETALGETAAVVPVPGGVSWFEAVALLALGFGAAYFFSGRSNDGTGSEDDNTSPEAGEGAAGEGDVALSARVGPGSARQNPQSENLLPAPQPIVVVVPAPISVSAPALASNPVVQPRARRRKARI